MNKDQFQYNKGFSLVEVILAVALLGLFAVALSGIYLNGELQSVEIGNRNRAVFLAHQGLEAVRSIRDENFSNLSNGMYGLDNSSSFWDFNGSLETIGIYSRQIEITDNDPNVKEITSTVRWQQNPQRVGEVVLTTLLSYWQEVITATGDWSLPILGSSIDTPSNVNGWRIDSNDTHAFLVLSTTNTSISDFYSFDITDPFGVTIEDSLTLSGQMRDVFVDGDYAYVSTTDNAEEIIVIDISDPSNLSIEDTLNLPGNQNMRSLFVSGSYLYAVRDSSASEFNIIDISDPGNISLTSSLNLSGNQFGIHVVGNIAYVVGSTNNAELIVINVLNPITPIQIATLDFSGNNNAQTIDRIGSNLFVGRGNGQLLTIDTSGVLPDISNVVDIGSFIRDIEAVSGINYLFIANDTNNSELQIYDVSVASAPALVGSYDNAGNDFNGVSYNSVNDFVVIASEANASELTVVVPS